MKVLNNLLVISTPANDLQLLFVHIRVRFNGKLSIIRENSLTFHVSREMRADASSLSPPRRTVNRHGSRGKLVLHLKVRNDR